jgi:hypothetical protein
MTCKRLIPDTEAIVKNLNLMLMSGGGTLTTGRGVYVQPLFTKLKTVK